MSDVIHTLEQSAQFVKIWGQIRLTNGKTLREHFILQGISLWDVLAVDLAVYLIPQAMRQVRRLHSLERKARAYLSIVKQTAMNYLPISHGTIMSTEWPLNSIALLLGFSPYMIRDILHPVAVKLTNDKKLGPVVLYDGRISGTVNKTAYGSGYQSIWQHWDNDVKRQADKLRHTLQARVAELKKMNLLPATIQDEGESLWPKMKPMFNMLFIVHMPRLLAQLAIAGHILEQHKPALIISPDVADPRTRIYCLLGRNLNIPSLEIVFGDIFGSECTEWKFFIADQLVTAGEKTKEVVISSGVPPERVTVTGSPRHDSMVNISESEVKTTRDRIKVPFGTAMVLFASTCSLSAYDGMRDPNLLTSVKKAIFRAADQVDGICLVVKPHPLEDVRETKKIATGYRNIKFVDKRDDIRGLTKACDAFVTLGSTSTLGALITNKLVIWPAFEGLIYWDDQFVDSGVALVPRTEEELIESMQMITNGSYSRALADLEPARQSFLKQWTYMNDGQASARIAAIVNQICDCKNKGSYNIESSAS